MLKIKVICGANICQKTGTNKQAGAQLDKLLGNMWLIKSLKM